MPFARNLFLVAIALIIELVSSSVPVPAVCNFPIAPGRARFCCIKYNIGCIKKGRTCTTTRTKSPAVPCKAGLTCVVSDFGKPSAGEDSQGKCQKLKKKPKKCEIKRCSLTGQETLCRVSGQVATCGAWATRRDSGSKPDCPDACTLLLQIPQPKGSDGKLYGNEGCLVVASCQSDFMIFGPVPRGPEDICKKPIDTLLRNKCCTDYEIGCAKAGGICTSRPGDGFIGLPICEKKLTCLVTDVGEDEFDRPKGKCRRIRGIVKRCSEKVCQGKPNVICRIPKRKIVTRCRFW